MTRKIVNIQNQERRNRDKFISNCFIISKKQSQSYFEQTVLQMILNRGEKNESTLKISKEKVQTDSFNYQVTPFIYF